MVSLHFSTGTLNTLVASDSATVRAVLNDYRSSSAIFDPAVGPTAAELAELETELAALTRPTEIIRVEIRRLDGTIVAASQAGHRGHGDGTEPAAADAASGQTSAAIVPAAEAGAGPGAFESPTILREFLPITPPMARCVPSSESGGMPSRSSSGSIASGGTSSSSR